jgi:ankyrin repeat protein
MLWHYVKARDYKKVEFLIKCGADPTVADCERVTPIHVALMQGELIDSIIAGMLLHSRPTVPVSEMLQNGPSLDELFSVHANAPDSANAMQLLLELGADVNIVLNLEHETPLIRAVRYGHLKVIKVLLKHKNINLYVKNRYGYTALHVATCHGQLGAVDLLLSSERLDVNCGDHQGNSAFWLSVHLGRDDISERFLNDSRVDINFRGGTNPRWQTTALYIACFRTNVRMVSCILSSTHLHRVNPNIQGDGRQSPLGAAAYQGAYEVVEMLLKADNIRINANDEGEDDPLWLAIRTHSMSVVQLFLNDSRLDINCQNNQKGDTYLIAAARDGNLSLVEKLLEFKGIEPMRRNREAQSALEIAHQLDHSHIVQMMAGRGTEC